jgi:ankyrin repeat protein
VVLLAAKGANVNMVGQGGQTALHLAASNEHIELLTWLVQEAKVCLRAILVTFLFNCVM